LLTQTFVLGLHRSLSGLALARAMAQGVPLPSSPHNSNTIVDWKRPNSAPSPSSYTKSNESNSNANFTTPQQVAHAGKGLLCELRECVSHLSE
jgi:hypothetical protein